jgi:glycine cleavage system transcriptional repressor
MIKKKTEKEKNCIVISAVGKDRPGIVAGVSKALFEAGCNLEDSSMTILGGEFAMILVVSLPEGLKIEQLDKKFSDVRENLQLSIFLKPITFGEIQHHKSRGLPYMISVYGVDKPGIVYRVTSVLAKENINITDVNTKRTSEEESPVYMMMLEELGKTLSITITLHPIETLTL